MLGRLPLTLLSLLLITFSASSEPTTPNDPFRPIVLRIPKQTEPSICCLKAPQNLEPADDDVLLSFEEWKAKQSQRQMQADANSEAAEKGSNRSGSVPVNDSKGERGPDLKEGSALVEDVGSATHVGSEGGPHSTEAFLPHFRVPITDRFNYASLDCSARVHATHKGAKSSASILSSKKDRYMLSPCQKSSAHQFVVVELCEDIKIDTVQMANFEFFSGVFKDFSVSVAKTYNGPWADAGTYRAKNIRGVQSFHTPATVRDFYRYIRIDFHSHYGSEYYCPLSLLRVYGLTHLEKWKWELWEAESKGKQAELEDVVKVAIPKPPAEVEATTVAATITSAHPQPTTNSDPVSEPIIIDLPPASYSSVSVEPSSLLAARQTSHPSPNDTPSESNGTQPSSIVSHSQAFHSTDTYGSSSAKPSPSPVSLVSPSSLPSSSSASIASVTTSSAASDSHATAPNKSISTQLIGNSTSSTSIARAASTASPSQVAPPNSPSSSIPVVSSSITLPPSTGKGGESIYRTIMNRLGAIETNHTLYAQYIEQQNSAIRDLIKRLNEDMGRLEAVTRSQRSTYQKTTQQWEKEKMQMIIDYNQLRSKLDHIGEEILLEKRLGVVQLCLLLAVLIFMGLTRGSRGESIVVNSAPVSMREWGRRHLRLSGDWNRFMRRSTSGSPVRAQLASSMTSSPSKATAKLPDDKVHFPRSKDHGWRKPPLEEIQLNTAPLPSEYRALRQKKLSQPRSRTPSLRTAGASLSIKRAPQTTVPQRTGTPTPIRVAHLRPQPLLRSNSHGAHSTFFPSAAPPKSAKKWARSAHLHPAKNPSTTPRRSQADTRTPSRETFSKRTDENSDPGAEIGPLDVFSAPAGTFLFPRSFDRRTREGRHRVQGI
ncbi:hypothetical protein FA13DRAFT_1619057 [Coprinellus micaceus]|uniref:SUN domain-containing protein n=1 Tax=Coprinellus micaceus TaxID=71717 RepID=A0A4Y7U149_COPMI|nr:hypothetical protein FA13DRAFT_1619057 [Coprinellus micaceus]